MQQLTEVPAQDGFLFRVLQERCSKNEVHGHGPVVGNVRAVDDLADAEFRDEMPQAFFREDHRIDKDLLLEVFARMFLVEAVRAIAHIAGDIGPADVGRQITAGVSPANLHAGKAVEGSIENQTRKKDSRFQRISDDIAEVASSPQGAVADDIVGAAGMNENQNSEFLNLSPERIE